MTPEPRFPDLAAVAGLIAVLDPRGRADDAVRARLRRVGDGRIEELGPLTLSARGLKGGAWWADERRVCILDGRLHDDGSLASALGLARGAGDAQMAALAAERWGERAPERLRGSYAYVVWDATNSEDGWLRTTWAADLSTSCVMAPGGSSPPSFASCSRSRRNVRRWIPTA